MLSNDHCSSSMYNNQYPSIKLNLNHPFKSESNLLLDDHSSTATTLANDPLQMSSPSPEAVYDMAPPQYTPSPTLYNHQMSQVLWNQKYPSTTNNNISYPIADNFLCTSLPLAPGPSLPVFHSGLPEKQRLLKRHHPRHHSANGILQQYSHYNHFRQQQSSQGMQQHTLTAQRRLSSSNMSYTNTSSMDSTAIPFAAPTAQWTANTQHHSSLLLSSPPSLSTASPAGSTLPSLSPTSHKQFQHDTTSEAPMNLSAPPLRYQVLLQASTAAAQKYGESSSLTYLNRGQAYGLHFQDLQHNSSSPKPANTLITSTISITFHDATHRLASQNYWRFWLSQQDRPSEARALDVDMQQSSGLANVCYPSFDSITIQWQSHVGATLFVRFNCLSTDFSRIKGVKGIPLRALVVSMADPASPSSSSSSSSTVDGDLSPYIEKSFCKIKLFRDKGAERKSKDDAKQISKQLDKIKADGNPQQNPLWHFYSQPVLPHSLFEALPEEDDIIKEDDPLVSSSSSSSSTSSVSSSATAMTTIPISTLPTPTVASNIRSSPAVYGLLPPPPPPNTLGSTVTTPPLYHQQHQQDMAITSSFNSSPFPHSPQFVQSSSSSYPSSLVSSPAMPPAASLSSTVYAQQQHMPPKTSSLGMKRSRSSMISPTYDHLSPPEDNLPSMKKHHGPQSSLTLFVDIQKHPSSSPDLKRIDLEELTVQNLISKLSGLFSLQAHSVGEVLWRRGANRNNNSSQESYPQHLQKRSATSSQSSASHVLVLVEDCVLENFPDRAAMTVEWEISSNGMVRFVLDF